jgi:hypothetical protein
MNTDHIIHNSDTQRMECQHCGYSAAIKMPDTIDSILTQFNAFIAVHGDCERPQAEAVMSEYIKGFDAGYDYVLTEIERWQDEVGQDLGVLLAHLRMESKDPKKLEGIAGQ